MKMKTILLSLCAVLVAGVVQVQASGDMKPGLWETRMVKMEQDGKDMLAMMRQAMASVPPEQRKKMGMSGSDPMVSRTCISPEMAKSDNWLTQQNKPTGADCAPAKMNRDGNRITFEMTCKVHGGTVQSKGETIISGDQATTKVESTSSEGGAKRTMTLEAQMKFLGSECGDVKPLDQMGKGM